MNSANTVPEQVDATQPRTSSVPPASPLPYGATPLDWDHFVKLGLAADLLPVVSNPFAKRSPLSKVAAFGKVPSEYNYSREARGFADWTKRETTAAEVAAWKEEPDYGICIQTREVRAIDVDVSDPDEAHAIREFIEHKLAQHGIRPPRRYRMNSAKFLMPISLVGEMRKRRMVTKSDGMIEFLANGQQFIAMGTHPSGVPYIWDGGLPQAIPAVSAELLDSLWFDLHREFGASPAIPSDASVVRETPGDFAPRRSGPTFDLRDDLADFLFDQGLVLGRHRNGDLFVTCPWEDEHTSGEPGDGSTVYFKAGTNSYTRGHFKCQHAHCDGRTDRAFAMAVGFDAAEIDFGSFDDVVDVIPSAGETPPAAANAPTGAAPLTPDDVLDAPERPGSPNLFTPGAWVDIAASYHRQKLGGPGPATTKRWNGAWYQYKGTHYVEMPKEELESDIQEYLADALKPGKMTHGQSGAPVPFWPTEKNAHEVIHALRTRVLLRADSNPTWDFGNSLRDARVPRWKAEETISMANGLFHLPSRQLASHTPAFFCLDSLPFNFDPDATCTEWTQFLAAVWPDDEQARETLQEFFGYLLSNDASMQKILYLYGAKRGGKGTIGTVMRSLLGNSNVVAPTLSSLATPFGAAPLIGKRAAIIGDARGGGRDVQQAIERLLTVSGEDLQTIDRKHREPWHGQLGTRFVIMSNEALSLPDSSGALATRFLMLKFRRSFEGQEDTGLAGRLLGELPGIFNWALAGLSRLKARGRFLQPISARDELAELELMNSPVGMFVDEHCELGVGFRTPKDDLYARYQTFCMGEGRTPSAKAAFLAALYSACPTLKSRRPVTDGQRSWVVEGLKLMPLPLPEPKFEDF